MQEISKQKYFYYLALLILASTYLPLVFNNLPPIVGSHHLWTLTWVISLIVFNPRIFMDRVMVYFIIYGIFLFIASETIWKSMDVWNQKRLFLEFYEIFLGVSVITYFLQRKDYLRLAKLTKWAIIFIFITSIMTIISSSIDPMYARNLIGLSSELNEREAVLSFKIYGGGTYSTAGAFMSIIPILIYYYKNVKLSVISKNQIILITVIFILALLGMQIFGNILVALCFSIIALLGMKKIRQSLLVVTIFLSITISIPQEVYVNSLRSISSWFNENSEISYKVSDLAIFIETGGDIEGASTGAAGRAERYPVLLETFLKSPVGGCYFFSDESGNGYNGDGGHLYWMNKLTITGILGLVGFLFILYQFFKKSLKLFSTSYRFYYVLAILSIISYGFIKNIAGRDTWYALFIILPGLYYLPLLKKPPDSGKANT